MALEGSPSAPPARPERTGSLPGFFLVSFLVLWACFIPLATVVSAQSAWGQVLLLLGPFGPAIAAVAFTARSEGREGVRALLRPVLQTRVPARWYLFALGYMAAIKLAAALIHRILLGSWPRFGTLPLYLIPFAIAISTPVQAGEEIGWRGYALPRLASRLGLGPASLVLGLIWAVWHLPQFFIHTGESYGQSFYVFAVQVVALSVAFAWLWAGTNRSLFLPMLLHAAVNNTTVIVPSTSSGGTRIFGFTASPVAWITAALFWICAAVFLAQMARRERRDG